MARGTVAHDHSPQGDQLALYLFLLPYWAALTSSAAYLNGQLDNEVDILMEGPTDYETAPVPQSRGCNSHFTEVTA